VFVALVGLFWGFAIFNETPTLLEGVAAICIIGAIFLVSFVPAKKLGGQN
jgi:drug/metabolite transporter (DMT)-like permease